MTHGHSGTCTIVLQRNAPGDRANFQALVQQLRTLGFRVTVVYDLLATKSGYGPPPPVTLAPVTLAPGAGPAPTLHRETPHGDE